MSQYIYLLQEREFIKTNENVYKVGMTTKENHKRFNQYPKGSVLLFQMICNDCKSLEKQVIKLLKTNFRHRKDIGNEYFEGEYKSMIDKIYLTIKNETDIIEENIIEELEENIIEELEENIIEELEENIVEEDLADWQLKHANIVKGKKYQENAFKIVCEKINNVFPDYQNDLSFGGTKKFIKIKFIDNEYVVYYINQRLNHLVFHEDGDAIIGEKYYDNFTEEELHTLNYSIICEHSIIFMGDDDKKYFDMLVKQQIIIPNKIYNLRSKKFINTITKMKVYINNIDTFINTHNIINDTEIYTEIYKILCYNLVINNEIYASIENDIFKKNKKIKDFDRIYINIGYGFTHNWEFIDLYKINKKYYDYKSFLRKYTPYEIIWDINKNYYILNRDYKYIGLNLKYIDFKPVGSAYLFNDGTKPWDSKRNYITFCNNYKRVLNDNLLKECLNMHNLTTEILSLLD